MIGRQPSALFGDADRDNFIFRFVDGVDNGRGRKQRDLVLPTSAAEKNSYAEFLHDISVWTRRQDGVNRRYGSVPHCRNVYRIFLPNAERVNSTASSAVWFRSSITGFTSTISKLSIRP